MRAGASWRQRVFLGALPSTADDARVASVSRRQIDVSVGSKAALTAPKSNFRFAPESGLNSDIAPRPKGADSVEKVFLGCRRTKILRAADAFYARRREGTISFHPKPLTDLRSSAEKRRSSRKVKRSTFARFLGLFDFRLLQQYLPLPEVAVAGQVQRQNPRLLHDRQAADGIQGGRHGAVSRHSTC